MYIYIYQNYIYININKYIYIYFSHTVANHRSGQFTVVGRCGHWQTQIQWTRWIKWMATDLLDTQFEFRRLA